MNFVIKKHKNDILYVAKSYFDTEEEDECPIKDVEFCFYIDKNILRIFRIRIKSSVENSSMISLINFVESWTKEENKKVSFIEINCYLDKLQEEIKNSGYSYLKENYFYKTLIKDVWSKAVFIGRGTYERAKEEVVSRAGKFRLPNREDVEIFNESYHLDTIARTVNFRNNLGVLCFHYENDGVIYNSNPGTVGFIVAMFLDDNKVCYMKEGSQISPFENYVYKEASIVLLENI